MWIPGTGELTDRLRRGLVIRGRVTTEIDELVVPVAVIGDYFNGPPFRRGIRSARQSLSFLAPVTRTLIWISNAGQQDLVVKAVSFDLLSSTLVTIGAAGPIGAVPTASLSFFTGEDAPSTAVAGTVNVSAFLNAVDAAAPALSVIWQHQCEGSGVAGVQPLTVPLGWTLAPQANLVIAPAGATQMQVSAEIEVYEFGAR